MIEDGFGLERGSLDWLGRSTRNAIRSGATSSTAAFPSANIGPMRAREISAAARRELERRGSLPAHHRHRGRVLASAGNAARSSTKRAPAAFPSRSCRTNWSCSSDRNGSIASRCSGTSMRSSTRPAPRSSSPIRAPITSRSTRSMSARPRRCSSTISRATSKALSSRAGGAAFRHRARRGNAGRAARRGSACRRGSTGSSSDKIDRRRRATGLTSDSSSRVPRSLIARSRPSWPGRPAPPRRRAATMPSILNPTGCAGRTRRFAQRSTVGSCPTARRPGRGPHMTAGEAETPAFPVSAQTRSRRDLRRGRARKGATGLRSNEASAPRGCAAAPLPPSGARPRSRTDRTWSPDGRRSRAGSS